MDRSFPCGRTSDPHRRRARRQSVPISLRSNAELRPFPQFAKFGEHRCLPASPVARREGGILCVQTSVHLVPRYGNRPGAIRHRGLAGYQDPGFPRCGNARQPLADLSIGNPETPSIVYSDTETYEHIYLNEHLYTWHCLAGIEKGLADTDRCHAYRIGEGLYLFVWREKVVPTLGVVMIDLQRMKTTGKILGYEDGDFGTIVNAPVGAFATLLNVTPHG
ncbi:MAG: MoaF C-terminal domain-containing protein [Desulfobacterales bacterium]